MQKEKLFLNLRFYEFCPLSHPAIALNIPNKFHNSLTEKPFKDCNICHRDLEKENLAYLIEKAYRRFPENGAEELLFEIAICHECAQEMRSQLSKESRAAVNRFFYNEFMARVQELKDADDEYLLSHCIVSGDSLESTEEYQIYAHCKGSQMADHGAAYLLSGKVIEKIQSLLSKETKDQLGRFSDDHLGTPPEFREILDRSPMLTI